MEIVELLCRVYGALVLLGYPFFMFYRYKKHGFDGFLDDKATMTLIYALVCLLGFLVVVLLVPLVSFIIFGAS